MYKFIGKIETIFKPVDELIVGLGEFLVSLCAILDRQIIKFGFFVLLSGKFIVSQRPKISGKILTIVMLTALVYANVFGFSAFEAHIVNVTAELVNDIPVANPPGGKFCKTDKPEVELSVGMEDAIIIYTINGEEPKCGVIGIEYSGPFVIQNSGILKARTCHDDVESIMNSWVFDFKRKYCGCDKQLEINKVYFDIDYEHGRDGKNEWIELYNPNKADVELKDWVICDSDDCGFINPQVSIPGQGYALISHDNSTWKYWDIPEDVPTIHQLGGKYFAMDETAEMLTLIRPDGEIVDQMNWGEVDPNWDNFNPDLWMPGIEVQPGDGMLGRVPSGVDTDSPDDWRVLGLPEIELLAPSSGEEWNSGEAYVIKWTVINPNGDDDELSIDIYYSINNGKDWELIITDTENDSEYSWEVPQLLEGDCGKSDIKGKIKVIAKGSENFMIRASDENDCDFKLPEDCGQQHNCHNGKCNCHDGNYNKDNNCDSNCCYDKNDRCEKSKDCNYSKNCDFNLDADCEHQHNCQCDKDCEKNKERDDKDKVYGEKGDSSDEDCDCDKKQSFNNFGGHGKEDYNNYPPEQEEAKKDYPKDEGIDETEGVHEESDNNGTNENHEHKPDSDGPRIDLEPENILEFVINRDEYDNEDDYNFERREEPNESQQEEKNEFKNDVHDGDNEGEKDHNIENGNIKDEQNEY